MSNRNQEGFEILHSIAETTEKQLRDAEELRNLGVTLAGAFLSVATIYGSAAFVLKFLSFLDDDDEEERTREALQILARHVANLTRLVEHLQARLNEVVLQFEVEDNRDMLRDLNDDYIDAVTEALADDDPVTVAKRCGIVADRFLRNEYDIWKWTDIILRPYFNPVRQRVEHEPRAVIGQFKSTPTLNAYLTAVLTWLCARERVLDLNRLSELNDDFPRLRRHLDAVVSRPEFDSFGHGEPRSLTEHIKALIQSRINISTRYPVDGLCRFSFTVHNWMTGEARAGEDFVRPEPDPNALCTVEAAYIDENPFIERQIEDAAGVAALRALEDTLRHVLMTGGSLRTQRFDMAFFDVNHFYAMEPTGEVHWRSHNVTRRGAPEGGWEFSHQWGGPAPLGIPWHDVGNVFPGGYRTIYVLTRDGRLLWYRHDGFMTGSNEWLGPVEVQHEAHNWNAYSRIIPGADGILYGLLREEGRLIWHRHLGYEDGSREWEAPREVRDQWDEYGTYLMFSGGRGVFYRVSRMQDEEGTLLWYRHRGYLTGTDEWEGPRVVGSLWHNFRRIFCGGDGTVYALKTNGDLFWYKHEGYLDGSPNWVGGVQIGSAWDHFPVLFARMSGTPDIIR